MSIVDMAIDFDVLKRRGSWLAYKGETIAQGKEAAAQYLEEHPDLMKEITDEVISMASAGLQLFPSVPVEAEEAEEEETAVLGIEEGILELDEEEK